MTGIDETEKVAKAINDAGGIVAWITEQVIAKADGKEVDEELLAQVALMSVEMSLEDRGYPRDIIDKLTFGGECRIELSLNADGSLSTILKPLEEGDE